MYRAIQLLRADRPRRQIFAIGIAVVTLFLLQFNPHIYAQTTEGDPVISAGAEYSTESSSLAAPKHAVIDKNVLPLLLNSLQVDKNFEGFGFDDNPVENINPATGAGVRFIPPDPIGAVSQNRVLAVVNSMIELRNKGGNLKWRDGLRDFFAPLSPTTFPFDPKVVFDQFEDRFVVVALELVVGTATISPTNISRILLAVSKDHNPNTPTTADWNFHAINSKVIIAAPAPPRERWADYPGFEVDEEAVYITANMFSFVPFGLFGGVRLWIVDKGEGSGGFYDGGPASVTIHDPYGASGIPGLASTTMPAHVFGDGGAGPVIGTFLVEYSGLSDGVDEFVNVIRVDNPLGSPTFSQQFINFGNLESFPAGGLLDAPQPGVDLAGIPRTIEVNDRRALDAVWRDNKLWLVATIRPNSGPDLNQTTAHWWEIDTSNPSSLALADHGNIGGEDIAPGTFTYFPAVAVNRDGHAAFGFSASAPTVFAGAYVAVRGAGDPAGTVQPSEVVKAGEDFYFRRFGGANNRWGDYSGIALDPSNEDFFWVFNEFADQRGTILAAFPDQDGRWGTAWGRVKFNDSGNAPSQSLAATSSAAEIAPLPTSFELAQNHPNPFNPETIINYQLPVESNVVIKIFNLQGQLVRTLANESKSPGFYTIAWDGRDANGLAAPTGAYFYQIKAGSFAQTRKMVLLK